LVHVGLDEAQAARLEGDADPILLGVSRFLRDRLRWVDHIGRWENNVFVLVLPETIPEHARGLVEKIDKERNAIHLPEAFSGIEPQLSFGIACWEKGDDMRTLMRSALQDLQASD